MEAATLLLWIKPFLYNISSISSQVKSTWLAPHCDAPTEVIIIGIRPIAFAAVSTAIFAPGIDPVISIAIVSPFCNFISSISSTIPAEKFGSKVVSFASRSPSSVVIRLNGLPTRPVSFGSFSSSINTPDSILVFFSNNIDSCIRLAAFIFRSYDGDISMVVLLIVTTRLNTPIMDKATSVDVFCIAGMNGCFL